MKLGCIASLVLYVVIGALFLIGASSAQPALIMLWFFLHPFPFLIAGYNMRGLFAGRLTRLTHEEYDIVRRRRAG